MNEAKKNRARRGWVLRILKMHSAEMNDKLLLDALAEAGHSVSMAQLHGDLDYLEEKGYVDCRSPELPVAFRMRAVRLTAKGTDLLEESITDPGIDVGHHDAA